MTLSSQPTMRALLLDSYQSPEFRDAVIPKPSPAAGQVLVRIIASGVNPIDYKIRIGEAPYAMPELPAVLGTDLAGVVESVGEGVTAFKAGDEVYGLTGGVRGLQGSLAEYAVVDADLLALKPTNLSMREAAALPLVSLTAWEGLIDKAHLKAGQKVLVQGGAGGVGHVAVQIARAHGAEVFAATRSDGVEIVRGLGATPIDVSSTSLEDYVNEHTGGEGFDVIYDTIGGPMLDAAFQAVAYNGHVASSAAFGNHELAPSSLRAASISGVFVLLPMLTGRGRASHGEILREITKLVEAGALKPIVDPNRFTLDTAREAHDAVGQGRASVKIVVDVAA